MQVIVGLYLELTIIMTSQDDHAHKRLILWHSLNVLCLMFYAMIYA